MSDQATEDARDWQIEQDRAETSRDIEQETDLQIDRALEKFYDNDR